MHKDIGTYACGSLRSSSGVLPHNPFILFLEVRSLTGVTD